MKPHRMLTNLVTRHEINQRVENQDDFVCFSWHDVHNHLPLMVLAVADGMGGHEHGQEVSQLALRVITEVLQEALTQAIDQAKPNGLQLVELKPILLSALQKTHDSLCAEIRSQAWDTTGTTIAIALIWENVVIATNLGDSPIYHYRSQPKSMTCLTVDHSIAGLLLQSKLITEEMARQHEGRYRLAYFVGAEKLPKSLPWAEVTLMPGDLILLCSDGVSGALSVAEIETILATTDPLIDPDLDQKAAQLLERAKATGETDNQTLILWRYEV
jgi:PPM family protein phosphatase